MIDVGVVMYSTSTSFSQQFKPEGGWYTRRKVDGSACDVCKEEIREMSVERRFSYFIFIVIRSSVLGPQKEI
jgi:hypothetical protein